MGYIILLIILIAIIVYFWSAIKIILGIIGIITLFGSIGALSDDEIDSSLGIPGILIGGALSIFFIFIPYWDICKWILLGIGILIVIAIAIAAIIGWRTEKRLEEERLEKERQERLERERLEREKLERKRVQSELESTFEGTFLPVPENLSETHNLPNIKNLLEKHNKLNNAIENSSNEEFEKNKKILFDNQLSLFYELNIIPESKISSNVEEYFKHTNLRKDIDEQSIIQRKPKEFKIISELRDSLKEIKTPDIDARLKRIENMDTSGVFGTSVDKLVEQTQKYKNLANELLKIVKELDSIRNEVNEEVTKVRLVAYRNVYLARELVNYYLSEGKNKEDMEKSLFKIDISKLKTPYLNISNLRMNYDNVANGAFVGLKAANTLRSSGLRVGKKSTVVLAAAGVALSAYQEREQKKEANRARQRELIKNIDKITHSIPEEYVAIRSTIELIEKITNANMKLYCEYVKLRDRVFNGDTNLSKNDFKNLIIYVMAFNEIRNDELKN